MRARTLLFKLLVLGPIAFIAWLGIVGRFSGDTWSFPSCSRKQHEAISLYRYPVRLAAVLNEKSISKLDESAIRLVAGVWLKESQVGRLRPIMPAYFGSSVREGVPGEIRSALGRVIEATVELADREAERGDYEQAETDLLMAYELAGVLKYSDTAAVTIASMQQRSIVAKLNALAKESPAVRARLPKSYAWIQRQAQPLDDIVRHMQMLYRDHETNFIKPDQTEDMEPGTIVATAAIVRKYVNEGPSESWAIANIPDYRMAQNAERKLANQIAALAPAKTPSSPKSKEPSLGVRRSVATL